MKLLRYGNPGQEKPGMLDQNGTIRDLSNIVEDISGDVLLPEGLEKLKNLDPGSLPTIEGSPRMGACVSEIGKFICIGLNYSCLLYTSPSPRDVEESRMPSSA